MVSLEPLFQGENDGDQLFAIFETLGSPSSYELEEYKKRVPFDTKIFSEFKNIKGKNLRKKFEGLVSDFENFMDLLMKMLEYLPENRITAVKARNHPFFKNLY